MDGREIAERYASCHNAPWDWDAMRALLHPDFVEDWPQSGERIVGYENKRAILENYPGGLPSAGFGTRRIVGGDSGADGVAPPGPYAFFTVVRLIGGGDTFTFEGTAAYADGSMTHVVATIELRDGQVWRATTYFAPPFEAPDWRAAWVERVDG
jgi:hypothetical protein